MPSKADSTLYRSPAKTCLQDSWRARSSSMISIFSAWSKGDPDHHAKDDWHTPAIGLYANNSRDENQTPPLPFCVFPDARDALSRNSSNGVPRGQRPSGGMDISLR
jgi:hypothetical protein